MFRFTPCYVSKSLPELPKCGQQAYSRRHPSPLQQGMTVGRPQSTMAALRTLGVLFLTVPTAVAFSSGGGSGLDDNGLPYLQPCDALTLCEPACPPGMTAVGPPERSEVYRFGTADGTTSYVPGQLLTMSLNLTARTIVGKRDAGTRLVGNETAKYLGLLLVDRGLAEGVLLKSCSAPGVPKIRAMRKK